MMIKKILLADDDPDFIEIHRMILENAGYQVEAVYTSREVLPRLRQEEFALLILDLMMEEKDSGFTVAYSIREDEQLCRLPILLLTSAEEKTGFAFKFSQDKEWMKVDDYAAKPLRPSELVLKVQTLLTNSH